MNKADQQTPDTENPGGQWAAARPAAPRSVFDNYQPAAQAGPERPSSLDRSADSTPHNTVSQEVATLPLARSIIYRYIAAAYQDPDRESWETLANPSYRLAFISAIRTLPRPAPDLIEKAIHFGNKLQTERFDDFQNAYLAAFGHAARGRCPLNEIEYGDLKADPLIQPHRLADLAAFYRAFGLELTDNGSERHDHLCLELEFMSVLAAKEAYALEHRLEDETVALCRDAQKKFLRHHLGRWTPAFARRLASLAQDKTLHALAELTGAFVEFDCAQFDLTPGNADLLLRPVDPDAEAQCASCGLNRPGSEIETT